MLLKLNENEIEIVNICLRLFNRLNDYREGYILNIPIKKVISVIVYYSSRLVVSGYYISAFNYYMFKKSIETFKMYLIWNKFKIKDYWLILEFIITFVSDFTIDDFKEFLSFN